MLKFIGVIFSKNLRDWRMLHGGERPSVQVIDFVVDSPYHVAPQ